MAAVGGREPMLGIYKIVSNWPMIYSRMKACRLQPVNGLLGLDKLQEKKGEEKEVDWWLRGTSVEEYITEGGAKLAVGC
jgi:hypothetical protein